jgi:outer membrane protein assembly factor BamD
MARENKPSLAMAGVVLLLGGLFVAGCGGKKAQTAIPGSSAEPDKILYERAMEDIRKNRHTVARLTLQTLINSYPDSEWLAKAKLAICESYYKEGGTAGLTQAVAECKDFITFFSFLPEAAYAQMLVANSHYRRMEKPDRDRTQARLAEQELQELILKFPASKYATDAEQRLREVQEVLAEGDYRVGRFYYIKDTPNGYRAAIFRLADVVDRYPLYSQADRALWMTGDSLQRLERSQMAAKYFERILRDYPLSEFVPQAKQRLEKLGVPIPQPSPEALERMQKEAALPKQKRGVVGTILGAMKTGPDVTSAARVGQPNLTPPTEGPAESLVAGQTQLAGGSGSGLVVETVPTGNATDGLPSNTSAASSPAPGTEAQPSQTKQKDEKDVKENKKIKESTSKKKKGLRKIIPW